MSKRVPIALDAVLVEHGTPEFDEVCEWPFEQNFVARLLRDDIPQRLAFGHCRMWVYRDPSKQTVGFGTIDVCDECGAFTGGREHPYVPLLAVNPTIKSLGYGTSILKHLIAEAAFLALNPTCHNVLFLDVYTDNTKAINVYLQNGFTNLTEDKPIADEREDGKLYFVMSKRISIAP